MSRSKARLAADWFAKLRTNAVTQEVEHEALLAVEAGSANATLSNVQSLPPAVVSQLIGPQGPQGPAGSPDTAAQVLTKITSVDGSGSGLDADLLDGLQLNSTTRNNQANKVVRTQANGYAEFGWINTTSGDTTTAATDYYVNTNDGYIRKKTLGNVRAEVIGGAGWGGVGSYAQVGWYSSAAHGAGATIAGSSLFTWEIYTSANGGSGWTGSIAGSSSAAGFGGTWRWMSNAVLTGTRSRLGMAVRIA